MQFVLGFCAISPIRKHKQGLRMIPTLNNFNAFVVGINMFKVNKKKTRCKTNNKDTGTMSVCYQCF